MIDKIEAEHRAYLVRESEAFNADGSEIGFWCLVLGLAFVLIACLPGCVHTPTPEDPATCEIGASASHGRGHALGEPNEDTTVTVWSSCAL